MPEGTEQLSRLLCVGPQSQAALALAELCRQQSVEFELVRTKRMTSAEGRPMNVVSRRDASRLYTMIHRDRVAIVQAQKNVYIRTHPEPPLKSRKTTALRRFCAYKAHFGSLLADRPEDILRSFGIWQSVVGCEGLADPRCLPFHVFDDGLELDLGHADERDRFRREYWKRRHWSDSSRTEWTAARPGQRHGREPQTVAGYRLDDGFHWDVSRRKGLISGTDSVWRFDGGYVNVYPDGFIREGRNARSVWTARDSATADETD